MEIEIEQKTVAHPLAETIKLNSVKYDLATDPTFNAIKLCVIPVRIQGKQTRQIVDLLIDTAAEITVINENFAKLLGVNNLKNVKCHGANGSSDVRQGEVDNIIIGSSDNSLSLGPSKVAIINMGDLYGKYNIVGLLGASAIQDIHLNVNYPQKYVEFCEIKIDDPCELSVI
ncbi:retropepsin-like aspartic protease [Nostoc sp. PCC 9305]|uniref:retropepsin-like aspartic protease n=1 Tax=Nostoc sp. PCC 9305 TaxID=296636 RepID=UPI0039C65502